MYRSRNFYARIRGDRALFTNPATKGGSERSSYSVPTRQALQGIIDGIYHKPTFTNVVTEVKVVNQIQTEVGMYGNALPQTIATLQTSLLQLVNIKIRIKLNDPTLTAA